jgi:hypothetical protein
MQLSAGNHILIRFLIPLLYCLPLRAQDNNITLRDFEPGRIKYAGFTLHTDKSIKIEAIGAGGDRVIRRTKNYFVDPQNLFAYAWIIDAQSRDLKWRMTPNNTESDWWGAEYNRKFDGKVALEKGEYELYYSANRPLFLETEDGYFNLKRLWEKVFGDEDWWRENSNKWYINVSDIDEIYNQEAVDKYQRAVKNSAIVSLSDIGDSEEAKKGFSLRTAAALKIYALGEGVDGEMFDFGYIIDANTRERVWVMEESETENAGGALKNRIARKTMDFAAGDYIVYYQSDPNHSQKGWNANPPYDPNFWGIMVSGASDNFDKSIVYKSEENEGDLIVQLDHLGDYEEAYEGFTLDRPLRLRIYAIGEGRDGDMFDFGWIENVRSGETVWEMTYRNTESAGGAEKNRRFDGVITLPSGSYIANFRTDDSHSYQGWNAPKPLDPAGWGIKIYTIEKGDKRFVKEYDPEKDKNILAQIVRVGDDANISREFEITTNQDVRVYALGEGRGDEMYDYAWIEDYQTGRTVWKMEYRDTRRAGGASKNRVFDKTVYLRKGRYILHYISDASHSYDDWNADPPLDKRNWGVTIYSFKQD